MGLISLLVTWPAAPIRVVIRLGELIEEQIEREAHDPAAVRRRLEEIERSRAAGLISAEEQEEAVEQVLQEMVGRPALMDDPEAGAEGERR
ncbi:gas vesicle protein GvpG [Rhizohabitans arisaemae]|uniref:gas vesicle protein GvpG n=1 Tax=Rhizohabitans arisaemae TaxID=2720610 RepID=UPI0024B089D3|nr:gas vesicle protein GvpG [Rhizohabitans arisaemae]